MVTLQDRIVADAIPNAAERRRFLLESTVAIGAAYAVASAYPFFDSMMPSERARSEGGPVEADIGNLLPGAMNTVAWRGKPVWVLRRTPDMLAALANHDRLLADPNSHSSNQPDDCANPNRSSRADVFVCIGVCTHLGCSPSLRIDAGDSTDLGAEWPGGFFCPCHGSKFDLAGRVFQGVPAPTNLEIPPYRYIGDTRVIIGEKSMA
jgi:ubiquinol-cytochrome c reductase iron-sulfur subunit